ncbi:MAG TPA: hypothetical protein DCM72_06100, partial [Shigella sp.]|nr:hypothetical protein [Shigella sp.]
PVFCLMVGAAIGLGSILTPYATGPSPIYYGSGYLPTADYWRLGAIFGLIFLVLLVITGLMWMPVGLLSVRTVPEIALRHPIVLRSR